VFVCPVVLLGGKGVRVSTPFINVFPWLPFPWNESFHLFPPFNTTTLIKPMNGEEEEPFWRTCVSVKIILPGRSTLLDLKSSMRQMPADGQLREVRVVMRRLWWRSPHLRLHASPKWLRKKLHSQMCNYLKQNVFSK
jgi:hypothetical protein